MPDALFDMVRSGEWRGGGGGGTAVVWPAEIDIVEGDRGPTRRWHRDASNGACDDPEIQVPTTVKDPNVTALGPARPPPTGNWDHVPTTISSPSIGFAMGAARARVAPVERFSRGGDEPAPPLGGGGGGGRGNCGLGGGGRPKISHLRQCRCHRREEGEGVRQRLGERGSELVLIHVVVGGDVVGIVCRRPKWWR